MVQTTNLNSISPSTRSSPSRPPDGLSRIHSRGFLPYLTVCHAFTITRLQLRESFSDLVRLRTRVGQLPGQCVLVCGLFSSMIDNLLLHSTLYTSPSFGQLEAGYYTYAHLSLELALYLTDSILFFSCSSIFGYLTGSIVFFSSSCRFLGS